MLTQGNAETMIGKYGIEKSMDHIRLKIALVHDWIVDIGGSEACLKEIYDLYPGDLYTLLFKKESLDLIGIPEEKVKPSFLHKLPQCQKWYRSFLPFMPYAIEQFNLSEYDLIISSSHAIAKGILRHADQVHICYCHSPVRYAWDLYYEYVRESGLERGIKGRIAKIILHYIRLWDVEAAERVDYFIANSHYTAKRIEKIYRRDSTVIYPPVEIEKFHYETQKENFYVAASRFVPYKRIDLIVEAFGYMPDKKLLVIGDGPDSKKIKSKARKNVEFLGYKPKEILGKYLAKARAFVFAAREDFGILPVEAQACGTPVIAFGRGGIVETVLPGKTGIFFMEQSVEAIVDAVRKFEKMEERFDPMEIRRNSERFRKERFREEITEFVEKCLKDAKEKEMCRVR